MPSIAEQRADMGPLAAIINRCLDKQPEARMGSATALLNALGPLLPGQRAPDADEPDNPYVGLAAFQEADSPRFFGCDRDVARLTGQLRTSRLVTVAGASGSGKSSLVRAGLIPALKRSGQPWEAFIARPGRQPLAALSEILAPLLPLLQDDSQSREHTFDADARERLIATLRDQPGYLGTVLRTRARQRHSRVLLFIDQFEELYTLSADRDTPSSFRGLPGRGGRRRVETMLDSLDATRSPLPLLQFTAARLWEVPDPRRGRLRGSGSVTS